MVGRFRVQGGPAKKTFSVWDAAMHGTRGDRLTEEAAHLQAADLELEFDTYGQRPAAQVRRTEAPIPVERVQAWVSAGFLDAWVYENGLWIGRVRRGKSFDWIPQTELRREDQF